MATIEINVPDGWEIDPSRQPRNNGHLEDQVCVTVPLRRKPRKLKAVVFEPAGEARTCRSGEWIDCEGEFCQVAIPTLRAHVPFIRREVYEGDDDAAK